MKNTRPRSGQLGILLLLTVLVAGFFLAAIATDTNHVIAVQAELHSATDAAALAGAQELWFNLKEAAPQAYRFAAANYADGNPVSNSTPGTNVLVSVVEPTSTKPGKVTVDASCRVNHMFASLFGRQNDVIHSHSTAGTEGELYLLSANQAFPIAVSIDAVPQYKEWTGRAIESFDLGDDVTLYMGQQGVKNATFTSFSSDPSSSAWVASAISQALGLSPEVPGFVPSVKVGQDLNLNNGILGQKQLAKGAPFTALCQQPILVLPLIRGSSPFNQSRKCVGFIGFKVKTIVMGQDEDKDKDKTNNEEKFIEKLTGTLVPIQVNGETGPLSTTGGGMPANISKINLGPIQLIE